MTMKKIKITDLIPLLNPGYVAMDANGNWCWYPKKPMIHKCMACWVPAIASEGRLLSAMFNIAKADTDWTESLQRIYKK